MYLCQECGSAICPVCVRSWLCSRCAEKHGVSKQESGGEFLVQPVLLLVGIALVVVGFLVILLGSSSSGSSAGCFFWPFPIILACGLGAGSSTFLSLGLVLVVSVSLLVLSWWVVRGFRFRFHVEKRTQVLGVKLTGLFWRISRVNRIRVAEASRPPPFFSEGSRQSSWFRARRHI